MLAADQARRAYELIQARQGQLIACRRCSSTGAKPVRIQHKTTKVWLAVLLCPACVIEGRAQGYVLVPYRP
jgi:late competence protein required for DNA uptake (superfamily II DNA/RNA helicase)